VKCEELLKIISDYIDGEIETSICQELERHLQDCDPCKIVIDTVRKTILLYKGAEVYEIPYELSERLHNLLWEKWREKFPAVERQAS